MNFQVGSFAAVLVAVVALGGFPERAAGQQRNVIQTSSSLRELLGLPNHHEPQTTNLPSAIEGEEFWQEPMPAVEAPRVPPALPDPSIPLDTEPDQSDYFMRPIREISIDIRISQGRQPDDRSGELQNYVFSDWTVSKMPEMAYLWQAPDIRYGQLYFEDVALERYGQTCGRYRQVYGSGAHFFCSLLSMPWEMMFAPAGSCDTPLGYCRPGNCTRLYRQRFIVPR